MASIHRLEALQEEIAGHHRQGEIDETFYQEWLASFNFDLPDVLPEAKSIIVVAVPRPQTVMIFHRNEETRSLIIPPTYVRYRSIATEIETWLGELLASAGYRAVKARRIPQKLLAVCSGLAEYGKNNITYVPGMGSFHQLVTFYSDLPCSQDHWREAQMMVLCQKCRACGLECPVNAITPDRFLLHAERCITFHNERAGDIPFPDWISPSWHNCLIGCMHCQTVCPQNREVLGWTESGAEFSSLETELLLAGTAVDQLPTETVKKFEKIEMADPASVSAFCRNLGVFF
jgi:epoxyqueuosine reductase